MGKRHRFITGILIHGGVVGKDIARTRKERIPSWNIRVVYFAQTCCKARITSEEDSFKSFSRLLHPFSFIRRRSPPATVFASPVSLLICSSCASRKRSNAGLKIWRWKAANSVNPLVGQRFSRIACCADRVTFVSVRTFCFFPSSPLRLNLYSFFRDNARLSASRFHN